jgi:hypothetical protein
MFTGDAQKETWGSPTSRSGRSVVESIHPGAWTAQTWLTLTTASAADEDAIGMPAAIDDDQLKSNVTHDQDGGWAMLLEVPSCI